MSPAQSLQQRPLAGIGFKVASICGFMAMASLIKAAGELPAGEIVFFRSLFALVPVVAMIAWQGELTRAFRTERPFGHMVRGLVGVVSMGLSFYALGRLPLPEWVAINYAHPLILVVLGAVFLGETVRAYRWSAVVVGFGGVLIVSWPQLTLLAGGEALQQSSLGVIAQLGSAMLAAVAMMLVRQLVATEASSTIVFWFSLTCTFAGLATLPFGWAPLETWQAALLVSAGLVGGVAQILLTESYRHAEMSTVAPFEYTSMILSIAIGYFAFGNVTSANTLVGGAIVVCAGLFIIWREHRLGISRRAEKKAAPPPG